MVVSVDEMVYLALSSGAQCRSEESNQIEFPAPAGSNLNEESLMTATASSMLSLGTVLPDFSLPNAVDQCTVSTRDLNGPKGVLVMFICNHCPFVIHIRDKLVEVSHKAIEQGFSVVAINANSERTHPQDGPAAMKQLATAEEWRFPFLFDESQAVARSFGAACTPDIFLFDAQRRLAYRGQFDEARPNKPTPVTGRDLTAAIEALASGKVPDGNQVPSIGCNIKWHPEG